MAEDARRELGRPEGAVDENAAERRALSRAQAAFGMHPRGFERLGTWVGHGAEYAKRKGRLATLTPLRGIFDGINGI